MSNTDNTRDKLVASMRKTKAGKTSTPAAGGKKTAMRKVATKPQAASRPAAKPTGKSAAAGTDPYQAGRRIWPD